MKPVRFNPLAEEELFEAAAHYEAERGGLGQDFLDAVSQSLAFAAQFPRAAPRARGAIRSLVVSRFPYSILYRQLQRGGLRVLAVAHHKRRPEYWRGRS
jgi:plasmid stabilization system protein ParE